MKKVDHLADNNAPHRNRSLKNLRNEKWKAVPGLEDVFEISNYGRIKSLAREVLYANGKVIHKKERIIMAGVSVASNYYTGDYMYQLGAALSYNGKTYAYSVARLVYRCFVKELTEKDRLINIIQKDGNGLNCHYKNLLAITATEKQKLIYSQNRNITSFSWLDMKAIIQKDIERRFLPVTQYSVKGRRIRIFKSIKEAWEVTGIARSGISAVVCGYWQTSGGYVWKKGRGEKQIDLTGYFDQWRVGYKEKQGKKVIQYSKDNQFIQQHLSITDAAAQIGVTPSNISRMLSGELKTAGGYIWKFAKK
jgi:hypothetical protein